MNNIGHALTGFIPTTRLLPGEPMELEAGSTVSSRKLLKTVRPLIDKTTFIEHQCAILATELIQRKFNKAAV
jgi:hypothetical protein